MLTTGSHSSDAVKKVKRPRVFYVRRAVDIGMTAAVILLLASQITGQTAHEWIGITMTGLVAVHIILNRHWYGHILKGRYRPVRIFQTVLNLALIVSFSLTAVSGMLMSEEAVPFFRQQQFTGTARAIHLAFSHWSFVLTSAHLGVHIEAICGRITKNRRMRTVLCAAGLIAAVYGIYLSIRAQIYAYMFFRVQFAFLDYSKAPVLVILENLLMMFAWGFIAGLCRKLLDAFQEKKAASV